MPRLKSARRITGTTRVVPATAVPGYRDWQDGPEADGGSRGFNPPTMRQARRTGPQTSPPRHYLAGEDGGGEPDPEEGGGTDAVHEPDVPATSR